MPENRLARETSPYLLQHKDNPVDWWPWGPQALAHARAANKPILLSVGYAACHWCHVMAHESFEDEATAAVMNRLFVAIKVDREERPDIDQIYMAALHALGEQGGWPLTMFLTPDGAPIWGGTYFPKVARYGRPAFVDLLEEVARVFRDEPATVAQNREALLARLKTPPAPGRLVLDRALLDAAAFRLGGLVDRTQGGVRGAPKFPQGPLFAFLWRSALRTGDAGLRDAVLVTLRHIAQGGITDHLGGGIARYSVDERWLTPHFEKMLYDNAQIVEAMTWAWRGSPGSGDAALFAARVEETIGWLDREMTVDDGAFAASIDADSEGHEGRFYTWSETEVMAVLGPEDGARFASVYDVTAHGNFEGVNILNRLGAMEARDAATEARLAAARARLLSRRETRVRPATDDKVLADWNGLAVAALALAGRSFHRPDWTARAWRAYRFVMTTMRRDGRLAHAWRAGRAVFPGLATDYAAMIKAALALHAATLDTAYLAAAEDLAAVLRRHHCDGTLAGYFLSADDAEALIVRPRAAADEATPSANALMADSLIRLWHLTGNDAYRADADALLEASSAAIAENLFAAAGMLSALDLRLGATDVVIVAPEGDDGTALVGAARRALTPNTILSVHRGSVALPSTHPAAGKTPVGGRATAYVCRGETCSLPVTDPAALAALILPREAGEVAPRSGDGGDG
jgi:uncharacterized protein YyaL (SSP411 family)